MAAFYADEHVPTALVAALEALGHDVLTIQNDGLSNQATNDADVLDRATALGRAVLTNNRLHFHRLHRNTAGHAGIVTYTDDADRVALAARIGAAVAPLASLAGVLVRVVRPNRLPAAPNL
jgi:predicted nuclease of predicted toxin-antitoxin system